MRSINTNKAPQALGPYSQAIEANGIVYCSGQIGSNPQTGELTEGINNQVRQVMSNINEILHTADLDLDHVVKTTIYLANINDFFVVNTLYGEYFSAHKPARSTVGVAALPKGALVEIEVIAVRE